MTREVTAKDRVGSCLIVTGVGLGLLTGLAFLLLLGAAVGIGMGGGLKNPDAVMTGFIVAAAISILLLGAGIYFRIRSRVDAKRASPEEEMHNRVPGSD